MDNSQLDQTFEILRLFEFSRIFFLVFGIGLLIFVVRFINRLAERLSSSFSSKRLFILQVATTINFGIYIFGTTIVIYSALRPPKELMIAMAGSAAVAIGFALKDIAASIIAGLILLFDRPFKVGDRVSFGNLYGEIQGIGLRTVKLVTLDDNLVTIPNSKFITDYVASGNAGALDMMICVDFITDINVDIEQIISILKEVVITSRFSYLEKQVNVVLTEIPLGLGIALKFTVKAYVLDVVYEKAFQTDIVKRGNLALRELKVRRPASFNLSGQSKNQMASANLLQ